MSIVVWQATRCRNATSGSSLSESGSFASSMPILRRIMSVAEHLYAHPRTAGVANILLSLGNRTKVAWIVAACAKKVDLKGQRAVPWQRFQNVAQGRVRDQATIPVGLAIDLNRREARGQGAARHHVLRPNNLASTVEI